MAHRIEPFRDYSEHEVVNLFALDLSALKKDNADASDAAASTLADMKNLSGGQWDSGVAVEVSAGDLPQDVPGGWTADADLRAYLGHAHDNAHIGFNGMPYNKLTVKPSNSDKAIGITLRQTIAYDENGENLLRYPVKKDELQAVGPGETVPVLTRGLVLLNSAAFVGTTDAALGKLIEVVGIPAGADGSDLDARSNGLLVMQGATVKDDGNLDKDASTLNTKVVGQVLAADQDLGKFLCKLSF
jgi:hypothetical protein